MECKELSTELVCYRTGDAETGYVYQTLVAHYEYGNAESGETVLVATRYATEDGTVIDTAGGIVTVGQCVVVREDICVADPFEGVPAGPWTTLTTGSQGSNDLPNEGIEQNVTATIHSGSAPASVIFPNSGNIAILANAYAGADRFTVPRAILELTTPGPDFPVLFMPTILSSGAVGSTTGLFGGPATTAIGFPVTPISVPPGVVEIAPGVWGSPGGNISITEPFVLPAGSLAAGVPLEISLYRSLTTAGTTQVHLFGTDPDLVQNRRPAIREVGPQGTLTLRNYESNDVIYPAEVVVVPCVDELPEDPDYNVVPTIMCDAGTTFLRHFRYRDGEAAGHFDTTQDGEDYSVGDEDLVTIGDCCSSLQLERKTLCDLNPAGPVGSGGDICVTKFIRETTLDCMGNIISQRDLELDGITPYTPVEVVDCDFCPRTTRQREWSRLAMEQDPDYPGDVRRWLFRLQSPFDPAVVGTVKVWVEVLGGPQTGCDPSSAIFRPRNRWHIVPDAITLGADILRIHLDDLDTDERVNAISPAPSYIDGNAMWVGTAVRGIQNDRTGYLVYDGVPNLVEYTFAQGACLGTNFTIWSSVTYSCCEDQDCGCPEVQIVPLCEGGQPFLRHYTSTGGVFGGYRDTEMDGETPYEVTDEVLVGVCTGDDSDMPRNLRVNFVHNTNAAMRRLGANSYSSVSVTFVEPGTIAGLTGVAQPAPAGFSWNVEAPQGGYIDHDIELTGANYLLTTTRVVF